MSANMGKRCINCGFLIALVETGKTAQDCEFDPRFLREDEKIRDLINLRGDDERNASVQSRNLLITPLTWSVYDTQDGVRSYVWFDGPSIRCLKNLFQPIELGFRYFGNIKDGILPEKEDRVVPAVKEAIGRLLKEIYWADRNSCKGWFPYEPGFSADEHKKLQVESKRAKRQEQFEEEMATKINEWRKEINWKNVAVSALVALLVSALATAILPRIISILWPPSPVQTIIMTPTPP